MKKNGLGKYNARSLKICGISTPVDGVPQDSLNGNFGNTAHDNGTTLTISTDVPITIEKLLITGGNKAGNGGGIYNSGTLTLRDCIVSNNSVRMSDTNKDKGAGIFL